MNLTILLLIVLIFIIIYSLYILFKNAALTKGIVHINTANITEKPEKLEIAGNDIFYDGWIFIISADTAQENVFIERELGISIKGTQFNIINVNDGTTPVIATVTQDLPLQKWTYFAIRYKSNVLEVYLNGKLIKTVYTNTNIIRDTGKDKNLTIGNSKVVGYLTKLRRLTVPPDSNTIWEYYLEGNGQFSGILGNIINYIDDYNAVISVYQNDVKQREQKLF